MNNRTPGRYRFHRLYYLSALAFIFGWAAYARFKLPPWPFADPDTLGYLQPAVSKLSGGSFVQVNGRNFLYPGFLLLILWTARSFAAITVVQHLIGLATGVLLLCCWKNMSRFVRRISPQVYAALGLGLVALYLFARHPIEYEHTLRPEAITPFFAILNILLTLLLFEQSESRAGSARLSVLSAALLINSVLLVTLKTSYGLSILFSAVPVLLILARPSVLWSHRLLVIGLGLIAAIVIVTTQCRYSRSDPEAGAFLPASLFAIHADLIARQIDDDLASARCHPYRCDWLHDVNASLHTEISESATSGQSYSSLGFDPDYLMYGRLPQRWCRKFFGGDANQLLEFYRYYFCRMLLCHPQWMAAKVTRQLAVFYLGQKHSYVVSPRESTSELYLRTMTSLERHGTVFTTYAPYADYLVRCKQHCATGGTISQPILIRLVAGLLSAAYPVILVAVVVTALTLLRAGRLRRRFALITLFIFSYNFGNCLGTAIVHSLDVNRYILAQYSFALLAECVGLLFLYEMATGAGRGAANAQAG